MLISPEDDDSEALACQATIAILLIGVILSCSAQNKHRHLHRLYLCWSQLLPDPRGATPWQVLWGSQNDCAFITTMGFDVKTFCSLLEGPGHFVEQWDSTPIPREDVFAHGQPRIVCRSLDAAGALRLILHYLGSAMLEISLQQIFALTLSTLSQYLDFAQHILFVTLKHIPAANVAFPQTIQDFEFYSSLIAARHPLLEGAFRSIDGLSLKCQESNDPELENATYNGWKSDHCISNILVFSPEGMYLSASYKLYNDHIMPQVL